MTDRSIELTPELYEYLIDETLRESPLQRRLREETARLPHAGMQIGPEQGQFMALLAKLIGARHCIEIGTFTGYSALSVALALPPDGQIICCDVDEATTAVARRYWLEARVENKIELRLAPALDTLDALIAEGRRGGFDYIFIDADKGNYPNYYERALLLLRPGGLMLIDNVLWSGSVADPQDKSRSTETIRALNRRMRDDPRIDFSLVPIGDGLALARKRR